MDWWTSLLAIKPTEAVASALLALVVILILRGWLVPKLTLDDARTERDAWKDAYLKSEAARSVLTAQNGDLLEVAKTANHIIASLPGGDYRVGQTTQPDPTR